MKLVIKVEETHGMSQSAIDTYMIDLLREAASIIEQRSQVSVMSEIDTLLQQLTEEFKPVCESINASQIDDLVSALINMGVQKKAAKVQVEQYVSKHSNEKFDTLLMGLLRGMNKAELR